MKSTHPSGFPSVTELPSVASMSRPAMLAPLYSPLSEKKEHCPQEAITYSRKTLPPISIPEGTGH